MGALEEMKCLNDQGTKIQDSHSGKLSLDEVVSTERELNHLQKHVMHGRRRRERNQ